MHEGRLVFAQLTDHLPKTVFAKCVQRYPGRYPTLSFSHWSQFLCMLFAQLTYRASLRDITTCLRSHSSKLYHAGFRGSIARSTLADANERRDCRVFEDFALHLIGIARALYANDEFGVELTQSVYAIDSSVVDLCLGLFNWAPATKGRAGIKLHTVLDLRGNIPAFIRVTGARVHDAKFLDHITPEAGSFYIMDRGYVHCARLLRFARAGAFFVIRGFADMHYHCIQACDADESNGILQDEHIVLRGQFTRKDYPDTLRRILFIDRERNKELVLFTNQFGLSGLQIAQLYKARWQVELFFKWIKQNLRIKSFIGTSENAVKIQIWTAISAYVMVAIVKKRLDCSASLHEMLQILSLALFETTPLQTLLIRAQGVDDDPLQLQFPLFGKISGQ